MGTGGGRQSLTAHNGPAALLLIWVFLLMLAASGQTRAAETQSAAPADQPTTAIPTAMPQPIPVEQIAPSATTVADRLRSFAADINPDDEIQHIRESLPLVSAELEAEVARTTSLLQNQPSLESIQTQERLWDSRQQDLQAWLDSLTGRVIRLQDALTHLDKLIAAWTITRQSALAAGTPATVLQQIDETIAAVVAVIPDYRANRNATLELQGQVARAIARCLQVKMQILAVRQATHDGLFVGDGYTLWNSDHWHQGLAAIPNRLHQVIAVYRTQIHRYLKDPSELMPLHLGLFVATLIALLVARGRMRQWASTGDDISCMDPVFSHPFSVAALLGMFYVMLLPSPDMVGLVELLRVLVLIPLILLARPFLAPRVRPAIYVLTLLSALDRIRHAFGGSAPLVDQAMLFGESLAGMITLFWLLWYLRSGGRKTDGKGWNRHRAWIILTGAALIMFGIGLLASLLGHLRVARLIVPAVLLGGAIAVWFYAMTKVATAAVAFALRLWPLKQLHLVQHHRERLVAHIGLLFKWLVVLFCVTRFLEYLGLWEPTWRLASDVMAARVTLGSFSTSAGEVLAFALTLGVAYLLSISLRLVLEEDVYPRIGLPTGISYAASSLLYYAIAVIAFIIALGFLGITVTQVTLFAGALGIGIGLGLQGLVQNFVAGLVLLFEQPIHVGDAVQLGELQGRIRRIGIRASILRTVQGAEVIIPNSNLIADQVINWTLSDRQRRLDLPLALSYDSQPDQVVTLLEEVAHRHPKVLPYPAPRAIFKSYGDNGINFELRVWTDYDDALDIQTDLAAGVYDAVAAAGLSFPSNEQEVVLIRKGSAHSSPSPQSAAKGATDN